MASVTQAEQSKKPSVPAKKAAPSQYQVETGQAVHAGEMRAAQAEGGKKGAMAGESLLQGWPEALYSDGVLVPGRPNSRSASVKRLPPSREISLR